MRGGMLTGESGERMVFGDEKEGIKKPFRPFFFRGYFSPVGNMQGTLEKPRQTFRGAVLRSDDEGLERHTVHRYLPLLLHATTIIIIKKEARG